MPLLDRQKKAKQIGEIRLGLRVPSKSGKLIPSKGETFRFTTRSRSVAQDVANKLGGEVRETELLNGRATFEVITNVTEVPVMVPSGEAVISQHYEMWTAAGCARRCDGFKDLISEGACKCPSDLDRRRELSMQNPPQACKPITRLNVMLPYVADLGVWLVQSTGDMAADELGEIAAVLKAARNAGVPIPAVLRMEQRISRIVGEKPHEYVVPVLDTPETSLYDLMQLSQGGFKEALPPPPAYVLESQTRGGQEAQVFQPKAIAVESSSKTSSADDGDGTKRVHAARSAKGLEGVAWRNFATKVLRRNVSEEDQFTQVEQGKLLEALAGVQLAVTTRSVDPETGEIQPLASDTELVGGPDTSGPNLGETKPSGQSPPQGQSQIEVLKAVFREQNINGPARWEKVEDVTGFAPTKWDEVTEDQAIAVIKSIESTLGT